MIKETFFCDCCGTEVKDFHLRENECIFMPSIDLEKKDWIYIEDICTNCLQKFRDLFFKLKSNNINEN